MGVLEYGGRPIEVDDRLLAHLEIVIAHKLRSGEGFLMSWREEIDGRLYYSSIWVAPSNHLSFRFDRGDDIPINPDWLELLFASANSRRGLLVMEEQFSEPS